jgi:tetratricopeptide (TPR) repeat protein
MPTFTRTSVVLLASLFAAGCKSGDARGELSAAKVSVPLWGLSTASAEARSHLEEGERLADEGYSMKAYEQFKRAVAADSAFAYGYIKVADYSLSFDEQKRNLERAEAYQSGANETEKLLIAMERKEFDGDRQGALELAQQLVAKEPGNARAHWLAAWAFYETGQVNESRASLKRAVDLAPEYGGTHLYYGNAYLFYEPKDFAKAEAAILAGLKLWDKQPLSYDYLGDLRRAQNRLEEAAAAYTRQIELDPTDDNGYNQRGHVYTFLGQYDKARADYTNAIRLSTGNGPAGLAQFRAAIRVHAGEPEKAIAELEEVIQAIDGMGLPEPDGVKMGVLGNQLVLASHIKKFDVAERSLIRLDSVRGKFKARSGSAEINRGLDADAAFDYGRVAAFKGDYPLAKRKAAEFMKLTTAVRNPTKNRRAHTLLGFVALFEKRYQDAIKEFEQGDPDSIYQKYHRGLALEGAGRTEEAKKVFQEVAIFNFNNVGFSLVRKDAMARAE